MPWSKKQNRLFRAVASGAAKRKGLSKAKAKKLAKEGVKK